MQRSIVERFATLTRVLDGQGLMTDSGTHGQRGYRGDYLFVWLGCTTPLDSKVWRLMAQLGSRLFFLEVGDQEEKLDMESMLQLLKSSHTGKPYNERLEDCKAIIHRLLTALYAGRYVKWMEWDNTQDPHAVQEGLMKLAILLSNMRSGPASENNEQEVTKELPYRAYAVLHHIARGHALVHGRTQLTTVDLVPVAQVMVSTMPHDYGRVFKALVQHKELTVAQVKVVLEVKAEETANKVMGGLERLGVVRWERSGKGKTSFMHFTSEWEWCLESQWQVLFLGQHIDNLENNDNLLKIGGCEVDNLLQNNLAQHQNEREEKRESIKEEESSQVPKNSKLGKNSVNTVTYPKKQPPIAPPSAFLEQLMRTPIDEGITRLRQYYHAQQPQRHRERKSIWVRKES